MKLKGVLLDLDNTVYDYETAHIPALQASLAWATSQLSCSQAETESSFQEARKKINTQLKGTASSHSRLLYFQLLFEKFQRKPYQLACEAEECYWSTFFQFMTLRAGVMEFLASVEPHPIVIITDLTSHIQFRKVVHLKLQNHISAIVTSEEAGREKPDSRIFEAAFQKISRQPEQLCMIGDSWEKDIVGARGLRMRSFWLRDRKDLHQLPDNKDLADDADTVPEASKVTEFQNFHELIELMQPLL